ADRSAWDREIAAVCAGHEPRLVEAVLRDHGVPAQRVIRGRDIETEPSLHSRHFHAWPWREDLGTYPVYSAPWKVNGRRPPVRPSPRLGEHNEYVLVDVLGKGREEIRALEAARVVGDRPTVGAELGFRPSQAAAPAESAESRSA